MHLKRLTLLPEKYPTRERYPFNLPIFQKVPDMDLGSPVIFFVGENGSGKSTLLRAICHKCRIHIWNNIYRTRYTTNPYENAMYKALDVDWENGPVPGSFFDSQIFRNFSELVDEWASSDPGLLKYFGGQSLLTQSHGQSIMSFFASRFKIKGLYLLDEPETALSPKTMLKLLKLLVREGRRGQAQFIIATHSPILMSCPGAFLYDFDGDEIRRTTCRETEHFQVYDRFFEDPDACIESISQEEIQ